MSRRVYTQEITPYPSHRRSNQFHSRSERFRRRTIFLTSSRSQTTDRPAPSLVTLPTETIPARKIC